MSSRALSGEQFRIDHESAPYNSGRGHSRQGTIRAYQGSGEGQTHLGSIRYTEDKHVAGTVHVESVSVDPAHRRQGIASRLYDELHAATGRPALHVTSEMSPVGRRTVRALATTNPDAHQRLAHTSDGKMTARRF